MLTLVPSLPLFIALVVLPPHLLFVQPFDAAFTRRLSPTFVNVVVLSSDPLVARISKRLITRYLTAIVIYNFHYIIRRFAKLIAPLESLRAIISYLSQPYSLNLIACDMREHVAMGRKKN